VESLDLLHAAPTAILSYWLGHRRVRRVQLGAGSSGSFLHWTIYKQINYKLYKTPSEPIQTDGYQDSTLNRALEFHFRAFKYEMRSLKPERNEIISC